MKKVLIIVGIASAVLLTGATVVGYQDWQLRGSAPSSPASGWLRMWADTAAGKFKCLTSAGAACYFDSVGSGPTLQTGGTNNASQTALNLVAGSNVTLTNSGADVTINSSSSGSGGTTIWSGAGSPNGSDVAPHTMTANNLPTPYVLSAAGSGCCSGPEFGGAAFHVSDGNPATVWGPDNNMTGVILEVDLGLGNAAILGNYAMLCIATSQGPPTGWSFQGSNDNSAWTTLDTRSSLTWAVPETKTFALSTVTAYRYFRFAFTTWITARPLVAEIYLYAVGFSGGSTGDFYYQTATNQWYGPRPSGGSPVWPLIPNVDANLSFTDVTTGNVSTIAHGFAPKVPNDATKFLNGVGAYSAPPGGTTIISGNGNPNGVGAQFSPTNMTSNSAPSPLVVSTTAGDFNSHGGWVVFSLTGYQYVTGAGAPQSLTLDLGAGAAFVLGLYKILAATSGSAYAPIAWTMAGSNDGSTFATVDTRAGQSFTGGVYNPYTPTTTTTPYRYFRINITSASGGGSWGMTALQLFAFATPVTSGSAGDWYFQTSTKQLYGPRPAGSTPVWPLLGTLN